MELRRLELFVTVAQSGSFSRAALALSLAQSSLSRQIALLEQEVGMPLLERTGRGVRLTAAGNCLLGHARTMLQVAEQARTELKEMSAEPQGRITVGLTSRVSAVLAAPLVKEFKKRLPHAMLTIIEGLSLPLQETLANEKLDLALLFNPSATALLVYEPLLRERLMLFVPAFYQTPDQVGLHALSEYPMVLPAVGHPIRSLVDGVLAPKPISLNIVAEVGAIRSALSVVEAGIACAIMPESAILSVRKPEAIRLVSLGSPTMWNTLVLAQSRARAITRLERETAQILRELAPALLTVS